MAIAIGRPQDKGDWILKRGAGRYNYLSRASLVCGLAMLPLLAFGQQSDPLPHPSGPSSGAEEPASTTIIGTTSTIIGTIKDTNGNVVPGATATLTSAAPAEKYTETADGNGFFSLSVSPGDYAMAVSSPGLAPWTGSLTLKGGEYREISGIVLKVSTAVSTVRVGGSPHEIAEEEVRVEETQRIIGAFPNYYVTYDPDPVPLTTKQKFSMDWKFSIDPFAFVGAGITAGIEQAQNDFSGYGQGAQGYGKRFGAAYADDFVSNMIGGAILPSLLHQDPRYYYRGRGSVLSRAGYAISTIFICKGDNGHWQPNYSFVAGNFISGAVSNLYYPKQDRGLAITLDNGLIATAMGATGALAEEFLLRTFTRGAPKGQ